jgi:DNA-binding NtrC family response regulator
MADYLPDIRDLADRVRFSPELGRVWRDGERCVLLTDIAVGALREQMINLLGWNTARQVFWNLGFAEGSRCAASAKALRPGTSYFDAFAVGPQAHALTGFGWTEILELCADQAEGTFEGHFLVHDSFEAGTHLAKIGVSTDPVCWLQTGFASGFATAFAGQPIIMREVECAGMGHANCLLIGRPEAEWGDPAEQEESRCERRLNVGDLAAPADGILGASPSFIAARHLVEKTADTSATLLFQGETGVGKELFARLAHRLSARRDGPFVAINCAAIPDGLIEAELFGVAKGAFTGAHAERAGRFERAQGGTLFLDEVASLSPLAQSKVLRAIQEREIERVGASRATKVDVRIIAAANVDLREAVKHGSFREDLYYRLATCPIRVPPLRERREDIPLLLEFFRRLYSEQHRRPVRGFTARALDTLLMHDYPGNVRELERLVERAVLLADAGEPIDLRHLFPGGELPTVRPTLGLLDGALSDGSANPEPDESVSDFARKMLRVIKADSKGLPAAEHAILKAAVAEARGNLSQAARDLGITRRQLACRLEKCPTERPARA